MAATICWTLSIAYRPSLRQKAEVSDLLPHEKHCRKHFLHAATQAPQPIQAAASIEQVSLMVLEWVKHWHPLGATGIDGNISSLPV